MLSYFFLKQKYNNYIKNNFFLDYVTKIIARVIVYNVLIQLAYFFAEKFMIEYYTRYIFNYSGIAINRASIALNSRFMVFYLIALAFNVIVLLV